MTELFRDEDEIHVGDYVEMTAKRLGKVRYIGELDGKKGQFYGVELWKGEGKNSGSHNGIEYFKCINPGMGVFAIPKAILWILDVPQNHDPFKQLAAKKAAQNKQQKTPKPKPKSKPKQKAKKTKRASRKTSKAKKISNNPKPTAKPKPKQTKPAKAKKKSKARRGSGKRPSLKYQQNKLISLVEREEKLQIIQDNVAALPTREPSQSIMSVRTFKSIKLGVYMTKGDNFDIAKRICKAYDDKFNDTDTVCLVSNTGLRPLYSLCIEGEYKRMETFDREAKYVLVYRAKSHVAARVKVTKQCFKSVVKGLSMDYENTHDVVNNLNILFGEGCHVVRAKNQSFDIYSRFGDGYNCEVRLPDSGECILAWRR